MDPQQLTNVRAASRPEWEKLNWVSPNKPGQVQPDADWLDWLTDSSSLTKRLKQTSHQQFQVHLLQQRLLRPALNEIPLLGMKPGEYALIRQVILYGVNQPWVFARTVIPLPTLRQGNRHLMLLGNRSLGSVLFKNARTRRTSQEITRCRGDFCAPFIWGRRSTFEIGQTPLLVTELFLEPFRDYLNLSI